MRPDETKRHEDDERKFVGQAKTDEALFFWAMISEKTQREHWHRVLNRKNPPPENKPLQQQKVDFLDENRRLLLSFAEARHWAVPEGL